MHCCQIDFLLQQYRRKQKASFHKALWEINEMSWPPYLCCYHSVCACVRARACNGCYHIEIGQVGSAPVYQNGVLASVWQSSRISIQYNTVIIPAAKHIVSIGL